MRFPLSLVVASTVLAACTGATEEDSSGDEGAITSNDAKVLDFAFDAEVVADESTDTRAAIVSQLMYAQGILTTARNGNGHVGNVEIATSSETSQGAKKVIRYTAHLPVAWPKDIPVPANYELDLPRDATSFETFNAKYDGRCGRNEYGREAFWHDWNPKAPGCTFDAADVSSAQAKVAASSRATTNKYPEYDRIWQDDRLDVVAIFGIIESDTPSDLGYSQAHWFLSSSSSLLTNAKVSDNAASASVLEDQTLTGQVQIGGRTRDVKIDVLVVQELQSVGGDFDTRYDPLSEKADLVLYNGHAGLGKNVNALARKGKVLADKYQLVLLNGCQTFAYIDTTLTDRRREANGDAKDPTGTRFLDVMANALPGYAHNLASMSAGLVAAAVHADAPKSFNDLMRSMPEEHIVVVFGEEDNAFKP